MFIPKTMSTQHPDNVASPFFANNTELSGSDEIQEAFYAYSHISCTEQLWDCEGKETDNYVVKKLLTGYEPYFRAHTLGDEVRLTLRVPNPSIEKTEAKILLETLESIPRNYDTASLFYNKDVAPIFEVALPMADKAQGILSIAEYYQKHVIGKQDSTVGGIKISDWIGTCKPKRLNVIPLFEEKGSMLNAASEVATYVEHQKVSDYQRVWLARSDPALNYGSVTSVLIIKTALQRLHDMGQKRSLDIYPILGCGSAPFRGNLKPTNVQESLDAYPSCHTFTLQSAFKYDYPIDNVRDAVKTINDAKTTTPTQIVETQILPIIEKLTAEYQKQILPLCDVINDVSSYIPSRRKRKLHIGLFGYSRKMGTAQLPRAIKFCSALYSLGIPPELFGLSALSESDWDTIASVYPGLAQDMQDALQYTNEDNFKTIAPDQFNALKPVLDRFNVAPNSDHHKVAGIILDNFKKRQAHTLKENIVRAGFIRGFLG